MAHRMQSYEPLQQSFQNTDLVINICSKRPVGSRCRSSSAGMLVRLFAIGGTCERSFAHTNQLTVNSGRRPETVALTRQIFIVCK